MAMSNITRYIVDIQDLSMDYKVALTDLLPNWDKGKIDFLFEQTLHQIFYSLDSDIVRFTEQLMTINAIDYFMDPSDIIGKEHLFKSLFKHTGMLIATRVNNMINPDFQRSEYILERVERSYIVIVKRTF